MPKIEKPNLKEKDFFSSTILFILKAEVFLIPIFWLPLTFEIFEFNKQTIFWILTMLAAALWLVKAVVKDKKFIYQRTPLDLPILIFLVFWGISSFFSVDGFNSIFGYYGRFADAYLSSVCFALFYFLIIHTVSRDQINKFFNIFIASTFIVFIASILAVSGAMLNLPDSLGRLSVLRSNAFNPLGASSEALAMFAAVILVFITALYSYNIRGAKKSSWLNFKYYLLFFLSLILLIFINFSLAWIALIISLAAIFNFALYIVYVNRDNKDASIELAIAPALTFFILSILFIIFFSGAGGLNLPKTIFSESIAKEAMLPIDDIKEVAWRSFLTNPLFGSGPGTFSYDFSLHRPASFNDSQFWQLRFDKASIYILELITTVGLIGVLSYLSIIGIFLFISFVFLKNMFRAQSEAGYLAFAFSFAALALFLTQVLYTVNTALLFIFWLALSLAMVDWRFCFAKVFIDKEVNLAKRKELRPVFVSIVFLIIGVFLYFAYAQTRYYFADIYYNNYRLTGERASLERAVKLNPYRLNYRIALAKDYTSEIADEILFLSSPTGEKNISQDQQKKLQFNITNAIKEGEAAVSISPNSVIAWETVGVIYRDVRPVVVGSLDPAIQYFNKASALEPSNPVLLTELGKLYLENNQTNEAANFFTKAIEMKNNYYPAQIGLAKTYESLEQADKALVILAEAAKKQPHPEIIYESGRLYYNQGETVKAIEKFKQAIELRPGYANAIYSLGLAYQKEGNDVLALEQFSKLLDLNPENEIVQELVEELQK